MFFFLLTVVVRYICVYIYISAVACFETRGFNQSFGPQVVREHYLRDDIYCGAPFCKVCDVAAARLSSTASTIVIVDTNVVLNQVNFSFIFDISLFSFFLPVMQKHFNFAYTVVLLL